MRIPASALHARPPWAPTSTVHTVAPPTGLDANARGGGGPSRRACTLGGRHVGPHPSDGTPCHSRKPLLGATTRPLGDATLVKPARCTPPWTWHTPAGGWGRPFASRRAGHGPLAQPPYHNRRHTTRTSATRAPGGAGDSRLHSGPTAWQPDVRPAAYGAPPPHDNRRRHRHKTILRRSGYPVVRATPISRSRQRPPSTPTSHPARVQRPPETRTSLCTASQRSPVGCWAEDHAAVLVMRPASQARPRAYWSSESTRRVRRTGDAHL